MKVKEFAHSLKSGDVLASGEIVKTVSVIGFDAVMTTDKGIVFLDAASVVELNEETNCLYGGLAVGHTRGFCTADSCY